MHLFYSLTFKLDEKQKKDLICPLLFFLRSSP